MTYYEAEVTGPHEQIARMTKMAMSTLAMLMVSEANTPPPTHPPYSPSSAEEWDAEENDEQNEA